MWVVVDYIIVTRFLDKKQEKYPVEERFLLHEYYSVEQLNAKIEQTINAINDEFEVPIYHNGIIAKKHCVGVRKIRSIYQDIHSDVNENHPPLDNSELIHSYMTVLTLEDAKKLAKGEMVKVHYIDNDPMEE